MHTESANRDQELPNWLSALRIQYTSNELVVQPVPACQRKHLFSMATLENKAAHAPLLQMAPKVSHTPQTLMWTCPALQRKYSLRLDTNKRISWISLRGSIKYLSTNKQRKKTMDEKTFTIMKSFGAINDLHFFSLVCDLSFDEASPRLQPSLVITICVILTP